MSLNYGLDGPFHEFAPSAIFGNMRLRHDSPVQIYADQEGHPDFGYLVLLVFEAVMEVVVIALPSFLLARQGMFDARTQKAVANITISIFTPCLIFSKLAAQLDSSKLKDLAIIPLILGCQTLISWGLALLMTRLFKLKSIPQQNFVVAMSVFGNSNSLPLSLVVSLSKTISGLHWDQVPGDNDDEVAARGILYLLVFAQLGQALRWSWGANRLLRPLDQYDPLERGDFRGDTESNTSASVSKSVSRSTSPHSETAESSASGSRPAENGSLVNRRDPRPPLGDETPKTNGDVHQTHLVKLPNGDIIYEGGDPDPEDSHYLSPEQLQARDQAAAPGFKGFWYRLKRNTYRSYYSRKTSLTGYCRRHFEALPEPVQKYLEITWTWLVKGIGNIYACLNVPLVAIIFSVVVAVVPAIHAFFFTPQTFVNNSVTHAIESMGAVAVPMIISVLGANLAPNTQPAKEKNPDFRRDERNMLIASLVTRMVLCTALMAPLLMVFARFIPISILADPIFIIVCFLLCGAPSALQLAQICQVNDVFIGAVSRLLFYSYVVFILPSTILLVVLALEVVEWAKR